MKYKVEFDLELVKNPYKGLFIAIEGLDASGKSTQAKILSQSLTEKGQTVVVHNPFEGEIGQFVRSILSGEKKIDPIAMQYLINANRQVQQEDIKKHLKEGHVVIIDRYIWSAPVYALVDTGLNFNKADALLCSLNVLSMYNSFIMPDTTFFLKISTKTAISRLDGLDKKKEIYENEELLEKVSLSYEWITKKFNDEFTILDGEESVEEVTSQIMNKVDLLFQEKKK